MAVYVGDTASRTVGLGVGGQTFTTDYSGGPVGAWAPTITEPASGLYTFTKLVTAAGTWVWVGTSSVTGDQVEVSIDVDASVSVYDPTSVRTTSRAELRRRIAATLGDLETLTATADGTTTTIVDAFNIATGTPGLGGREMILTSGTYVGSVVRITGSDSGTHTATFEPALPGAVAAGVTAEVYNERSRGFRVAEYHRAINAAIQKAYPVARTEIAVAVGDMAADGLLATPTAVSSVFGVEVQDTEGVWWPLSPARHRGYAGWTADPTGDQLVVDAGMANLYLGRPVRVLGFGRHPELNADAEVTTLNPEWLVYECCADLCRAGADRDGTRAQFVMMYEQKAMAARGLTRTRWKSSSRRARVG